MLGSIYIGLSGMSAYSKGLQTISNNVANLNTPGYKSTSVSFADVFSQGGVGSAYFGSGSNAYGGGVRFNDAGVDFGQGDLRQTSGDLDLAIQGAGLLVLLDGDRTYYARTGQFKVGEDGYIVDTATGYRLAVLDANQRPQAINIDLRQSVAPVATTKITLKDFINPGNSTVSAPPVNVYGVDGVKQVWSINFTKKSALPADHPAGAASAWDVEVKDSSNTVLGTRTVYFGVDGTMMSTAEFKVGTHPEVTINLQDVKALSGAGNLRVVSDGSPAGSLTTVSVDKDGKVKLTYSNETSELVGSVAIADFRDPNQLERVGNGLFRNLNGGEHRLLASAQDGIGTLMSKQIEASNVDLSQQFGDLILIQRGFQASSQVVSVSNDMIQQLFGIRGQG